MPLDGTAQFILDPEEAVRRRHPLQRLVGAFVVVVFDPIGDALARLFKGVEPRPAQKLVFERLPEPLDLAQRHRMMRRAADVVDVVPLEFLLELRHPAPAGVLPAVVRQHLLRRPERARRLTVHLHHVLARLAAVHTQPGDVARVVVDEPDDVGHLAQDREVGDVRLPHLVGRRGLEAPWRRLRFLPHPGFRCPDPRHLQVLAHRFRTGLEAEHPAEDLRDPLATVLRILSLQLDDLRLDRRGHPGPVALAVAGLQPGFPVLLIPLGPFPYGRGVDPQLLRHHPRRDPFLDEQLHRTAFEFEWVSPSHGCGSGTLPGPRSPPRGRMNLLSTDCYRFALHGQHSFFSKECYPFLHFL
jgi:hypothetical protein